eukprot:a1627_136.p1 GENE.a1627_136~~a1627_136.p1  ORF type:complete len:534 (+),score=209.02 a1627_136:124-1602(+)
MAASSAPASASAAPSSKIMRMDNINENLKRMEYAVRGRLVQRAEEIAAQLAASPGSLPFDEVTFCNIGNPQALEKVRVTFVRQVLALVTYPELLDTAPTAFPEDARARAREILASSHGVGAYTHSKGMPYVRKCVADFIAARDGVPSDPNNIFVTDGASPGIVSVLKTLVRDSNDAIMLPVPQYPLYSATITAIGGTRVDYLLDEANDWGLSVETLARSLSSARGRGLEVRALVVINPGNPTGQCLSESNIREILEFCARERLVVLSDEVYQVNVYDPARPFHSFKKVRASLPAETAARTELFSFHSVSKGVLGECGLRGGYMELTNIDDAVAEQLYKNASVSLCSNTIGQLAVGLMCKPPVAGEPSFQLYREETHRQFTSLQRRAKALVAGLNRLEGVSCNDAQGAMYCFPKVTLPPNAIARAAELGLVPDTMYCLELLENTGVCVVPGSGFGQADGTWHFRTTFLPPESKMESVVERMAAFHADFMRRYK